MYADSGNPAESLETTTLLQTPVSSSTTQFNQLVSRLNTQYPSLLVTTVKDSTDASWAVIEGTMTTNSPFSSPVRNPRMVIHAPVDAQDITFRFEVHFMTICSGNVKDESFSEHLQSMIPDSGYFLCSGLPEHLAVNLTFEIKQVRKWNSPFTRIDHRECRLWFRPKHIPACNLKYSMACDKCMKLRHYVSTELKRRASVTPEVKAQRVLPTSNYPITYLTPTSKTKRLMLTIKEQKTAQHRLKQYQEYDINVGEATSSELLAMVSHIQQKTKKKLEDILAEADSVGKGDILREKWKMDVEDRLAFTKDQQQNGKRTHKLLYILFVIILALVHVIKQFRRDHS